MQTRLRDAVLLQYDNSSIIYSTEGDTSVHRTKKNSLLNRFLIMVMVCAMPIDRFLSSKSLILVQIHEI